MIKSIANFIWDNHVDGVDIDWVSHECNKVDVQNDAANLLVFLRELRESLNSAGRFSERKLLVALGVGMQPFSDTQGPLSDVSEYSKYVDYINILAYDINGPDGNTTGPNSPLNYELNRGSQYSLISAIDSWTSAKFPINQITAGIAFYGRSFKSIVDMSNQSWNEYQPAEGNVPRGDDDDGLWADRCTGKPPSFSGIWSYRNLRKQGVLKTPEAAAAPWLRNWDSISLTPWVFNTNSKIFISYDDPWSVSAKANYVLERGLGGVTVYDVTMDYNDELLGAVKRIIGSKTTHENTVPVTESSTSSAETSTLEASATQSPPFESQGSSETVLAPIASSTDAASSDSSSSTPQATSTIPAIVSTSTAADLTLTTTSIDNDVPRVGDSCGWQPVYKCVAKDGKDAIFLTCVGGAWIQQQCATGTASGIDLVKAESILKLERAGAIMLSSTKKCDLFHGSL
ncbi:hypothetical protein GGI07_003714 [Coemansia sp. Benny D115]|nr:hypothetical protein GGI07_003714 [Coemansia sp. Benny D115]